MLFKHTLSVMSVITLVAGSSLTLAADLAKPSLASSPIIAGAIAQVPNNDRGGRRSRPQLMEQLNLTDTQKQQMARIRQKYEQQMRPLITQLQTQKQQLSQMLGSNSSDSAIRAKHRDIVELRQRLQNIRFDGFLEMREVLTSQQRSQLAQMMQKRGKLREDGEDLSP